MPVLMLLSVSSLLYVGAVVVDVADVDIAKYVVVGCVVSTYVVVIVLHRYWCYCCWLLY